MKHRVLYTADVHINRKVFVCFLLGNKSFVVLAVHVAEEIPGRTSPLRHGVGLSLSRSAAAWAGCVHPLVDGSQRRLTCTSWLVAVYLRQRQRKLILRNRHVSALRTVDNRNRLAPVSLAGEYPVAQLVVDSLAANTHFFNHLRSFLLQDRRLHSVPLAGIDHGSACLCVGLCHVLNLFSVLGDNLDNRNAELGGKLKVAVIVSRNTHNSACTVICQYIVGQPDRNLCSI